MSLPSSFKAGDFVSTPYGRGKVRRYRSDDEIYEVAIHPSTTSSSSDSSGNKPSIASVVTESDPENKTTESTTDDASISNNDTTTTETRPLFVLYCPHSQLSRAIAMELDVAYQALETMRKLNLEMECQELCIPVSTLDLEHHCTVCLLARTPVVPNTMNTNGKPPRRPTYSTKKSTPCLCCGRPVCSTHASATFKKERVHMCKSCEGLFGNDYVVTILTNTTNRQRRQLLDRLMDVYDRAVLVLRYAATSSELDKLCTALESATVRQNRVGLGSSSAGIVSGVLGIVSCATLLTPVGPPLVIASLVFGGSAAAAQTGAEVRHTYFFQPNQQADRIIALHGLCWNIVKIVSMIRDTASLAVAHDKETTGAPSSELGDAPIEEAVVDESSSAVASQPDVSIQEDSDALIVEKNSSSSIADDTVGTSSSSVPPSTAVTPGPNDEASHQPDRAAGPPSFRTTPRSRSLDGSNSSSVKTTGSAAAAAGGAAGAGAAALALRGRRDGKTTGAANNHSAANRGARFLSRSTTAALNSMQFARVGGGALSAATLLWETHNLRNTLQKMKAGNPCAKADTLRSIRDEILASESLTSTNSTGTTECLPTTTVLALECDQTLDLLNQRSSVMTADEVHKLLDEHEIENDAMKEDHSSSSNASSLSSSGERITEHSGSERAQPPPPPARRSLRERLWGRPKEKAVANTTASHNSSVTSIGFHEEEEGDDHGGGGTGGDDKNCVDDCGAAKQVTVPITEEVASAPDAVAKETEPPQSR